MAKKKGEKFMGKLDLKAGALRSELKVPAGKNIPAAKLKAATKSKNPLERKRAVLAETFKKANRKKGK
jgi:hypothetical protein